MRKFITILISCSLALAASAMAQQDNDAQPTPKKKQHQKAQAAQQSQPAPKRQTAQPPRRSHAVNKENAPANAQPKRANERKNARAQGERTTQRKANTQAESATERNANAQTERQTRRNAKQKAADTNKPAAPANAQTSAQEQAPAATQANQPNRNKRTAKAKKPDVQVVQKIKSEHANFHAQPKPKQVPAVTFNQSRRINGAEHWQGEQYAAFRSYRPERHDRNWYHSHYNRIELIGGGYYYWNNGYWYPAWGYNPSVSYYVYDGPIYTGTVAEPPDRVIANVQAVLQEQGYYRGEVDGLLGPLTREALTGYQADHGLYTTAAIDQPTLESLGMAG